MTMDSVCLYVCGERPAPSVDAWAAAEFIN
jgi:hypothetical protein